MDTSFRVGIDAGGTLVKLVYWSDGRLFFRKLVNRDALNVLEHLRRDLEGKHLCITGGKADYYWQHLPPETKKMAEFEATCLGARELMASQHPDISSWILTNIGTGTSIHYVSQGESVRAAGIGLGGGTLMGLAYLLTGIRDYDEIVAGSLRGQRSSIDITVQDIYQGITPPIPGHLTASNFAKAWAQDEEEHSTDDQLAAITGMIGESIVTISAQVAEQYGCQDVVYIGSTLSSHSHLKQMCAEYTPNRGKNPLFLHYGEFSGALGALMTLPGIDQSRLRQAFTSLNQATNIDF
ncbi:type II pantothenate kinase [Bacillaceae bacterium SIJ1]|uniref:type II pantothenate kinase n=1 Tax=Litoribacterium kuwaitense TaxID=1398745 RepID=UPI0013EA2FF2|nr:type II pantothenate kinase [Litoribacterium kuwaitense]NGP46308.1 type II pantothenate kinase [Litoribacterium kuwaitense]